MNLSTLQRLPTKDKLLWLRTTAGLTTLEEWLSLGNSLRYVAEMIGVDSRTLYRWRERYPEIAELIALYSQVRVTTTKCEPVNLARPTAYRILVGYDHNSLRQYTQRGCSIHSEYATAVAVWESDFIERYFKIFGVPKDDYLNSYLERIRQDSVYHLSNLFTIAYSDVSRMGVIRLLKGGVANI